MTSQRRSVVVVVVATQEPDERITARAPRLRLSVNHCAAASLRSAAMADAQMVEASPVTSTKKGTDLVKLEADVQVQMQAAAQARCCR